MIKLKIKSEKLKKKVQKDTRNRFGESGQILVETMVALTMVVIGLLGLLGLLTYSIGLNRVVTDQYVASYLAAEGIEVIKNIIDTDVANGNAFNQTAVPGTYEVDYNTVAGGSLPPFRGKTLQFDGNGTKKYTYNPAGPNPSPTSFVRKIIVAQGSLGQNELDVQSIVTWTTRGGGNFSVTLEDHFYNWRQ